MGRVGRNRKGSRVVKHKEGDIRVGEDVDRKIGLGVERDTVLSTTVR